MLRMNHEKELEEEEKIFSECSSGCQSGWTMYLDNSYKSRAISTQQNYQQEEDNEEEEDLSMVSDASSGPPHFRDEGDEHCCCKNGKKRRVDAGKQRITKQEPHSSLLDDTASSPFFSSSKTSCNATTTTTSNKKKLSAEDVLELSCGFSATPFRGKSALRKHLGYFKSCAPIKSNSVSREEGEKKLYP